MKVQNLFIALTTSIFAVSSNPAWSVAAATHSTQNVTRQTPATLVAQVNYGTTRTARTCPSRVSPKRGAISLEQAKRYFICDYENVNQDGGTLVLADDLKLQISSTSRSATSADLELSREIILKQPVYPIKASYTLTSCLPITPPGDPMEGKNCVSSDIKGPGVCFRNTAGDWSCAIQARGSMARRVATPN